MKEESDSSHVCLLKTGMLVDYELAANALTENDIPFYKQMETITGLKLGTSYIVFVNTIFYVLKTEVYNILRRE